MITIYGKYGKGFTTVFVRICVAFVPRLENTCHFFINSLAQANYLAYRKKV